MLVYCIADRKCAERFVLWLSLLENIVYLDGCVESDPEMCCKCLRVVIPFYSMMYQSMPSTVLIDHFHCSFVIFLILNSCLPKQYLAFHQALFIYICGVNCIWLQFANWEIKKPNSSFKCGSRDIFSLQMNLHETLHSLFCAKGFYNFVYNLMCKYVHCMKLLSNSSLVFPLPSSGIEGTCFVLCTQ